MNCQICTGSTDVSARYDCGHQICMACAVRLVFLYMQSGCPLCRGTTEAVVFSASSPACGTSRRQWKGREAPVAVFYEGADVRDRMEDLLSNKCQKCHRRFGSLKELKKHYAQHGFVLCSECIGNRKDFWNEIRLYRSSTIRDHKNGSLEEEGFSGHVLCIHCKIYLFDSDDARRHCNLRHEACHVCDMVGIRYQYYSSFEDLEAHYRNAHYCCTFQTCRVGKCYVFPYHTELLEHLTRFHKVNARLSEIPRPGRCSIPVMDPFKRKKAPARVSVIDPSGGNARAPMAHRGGSRQDTASPSTEAELPKYLNRNILEEERRKLQKRRLVIDRICKAEGNEIEEIINEFLGDSIDVTEAFNRISKVTGDAAALKLFESAPFGPKQSVVEGSIKALRKRVMFPKFVPSEPVRYREPERKGPGFTVIDLHKRK
ncbi:ZINC FINGER PROTEIN [Encephalitozoon cuniculi GB-M1]|uniref:ZINC FINGER PROTEIN n=1 Tax=Encephalitozoon cuniculi (strain GB-M1) TaxID=284813 RepID=Q8SSL3_ENCCU|nr:uncharacterized protein ECU01_0780 [Encephalitozoon cuniculi GB-M1]CAD24948.1 ZINC FINGER PROTEIN [Encephalitozoon cuniculi GB-M1]